MAHVQHGREGQDTDDRVHPADHVGKKKGRVALWTLFWTSLCVNFGGLVVLTGSAVYMAVIFLCILVTGCLGYFWGRHTE